MYTTGLLFALQTVYTESLLDEYIYMYKDSTIMTIKQIVLFKTIEQGGIRMTANKTSVIGGHFHISKISDATIQM